MNGDSSFVVTLIIALVERVIFGLITLKINGSKGRDGGFAWGFFLGGIGIIVTATRSSLIAEESSYQKNYPSYLTEQKQPVPQEPAKPKTWKCIKCETENSLNMGFCSNCGEHRHYNWKCEKCGNDNASDIKFCPNCGNERTDEQELTPQSLSVDENFLATVEEMANASEIADAFIEKYGAVENEDAREMIKILEKARKMERSYGNMKNFAIKRLTAFFKYDMKFYTVDRSNPSISCPVCGKVQNNDRENCFGCGALFKE